MTKDKIILLQGIVILLLSAIEVARWAFRKDADSRNRWERIRKERRLLDRLEMAEASGSVWENRYFYMAEQMARVQLYAHRGDLRRILEITKEANTYEHVDRRDDGLDRSPFCGAGHHVVHASAGEKTEDVLTEPVGAAPGEGR